MKANKLQAGLWFLLLLPLVTGWQACRKTEAVEQELIRDSVITGNKPPPFNGVSETQLNNYINKAYIDLLGREPLTQELEAARNTIRNGGYSGSAREQMLNQLIQTEAFFRRTEELLNARLLNATDSSDIADMQATFNLAHTIAVANGDVLQKAFIELEMDRLQLLASSWQEYRTGSITIKEYYRRHLLNYFYDEINMGSENFVKGTFENLYKRLPIQEELRSGIGMCDGTPSFLFFQSGSSKGDFARIATDNVHFYEGLALEAYNSLLQRQPSSVEMSQATTLLNDNQGNYPALQVQLMISKEYAGF